MLTRRFDGRPAHDVPPYRRLLPFLMRGRNESAVYFSQTVDLTATLPWLESASQAHGRRITVFQLILAALARALHERPRLNRFVSGGRVYERDGVWISFAAKKRLADEAPLSVVKRRFDPGESLLAMVDALERELGAARSDRRRPVDRETSLLLGLPPLVLGGVIRLAHALDHLNLMPRFLLEHDPMYASVFVSNLGSIKLGAAYHHLYEHGNCPLFVTVGKIERAAVVTASGAVEPRSVLELKYTYDERVEDGLYCARALELVKSFIEDPASLG